MSECVMWVRHDTLVMRLTSKSCHVEYHRSHAWVMSYMSECVIVAEVMSIAVYWSNEFVMWVCHITVVTSRCTLQVAWKSHGTWMSHVSHEWVCYMSESCHSSHVTLHFTVAWKSHGTRASNVHIEYNRSHEWVMSHMSECVMWVRHITVVMSHCTLQVAWKSHGTQMSHVTHEWVMSRYISQVARQFGALLCVRRRQ